MLNCTLPKNVINSISSKTFEESGKRVLGASLSQISHHLVYRPQYLSPQYAVDLPNAGFPNHLKSETGEARW